MVTNYIPDRGDIVFLDFQPQSGKEQTGRRPAIILSPKSYNQKVGLALCCPITSQIKAYPFEVLLPPQCTIQGVILSDHVKSLDFHQRNIEFKEIASYSVVQEVLQKLQLLID